MGILQPHGIWIGGGIGMTFFNPFPTLALRCYRKRVYNEGGGNPGIGPPKSPRPAPIPAHGHVSVRVNGQNVPVFRGGNTLIARKGDVRFHSGSELLKNTRGVSLNTDPSKVSSFGSAYKVISIPKDLRIVHTSGTHFEIAPRVPMTFETFQGLLGQVVLTPYP